MVWVGVGSKCVDDSLFHSSTVKVNDDGTNTCPRCGKVTVRPATDAELQELCDKYRMPQPASRPDRFMEMLVDIEKPEVSAGHVYVMAVRLKARGDA